MNAERGVSGTHQTEIYVHEAPRAVVTARAFVESPRAWLSASFESPNKVVFLFDRTLPAGSYSGAVMLQGFDRSGDLAAAQRIPVTYTVMESLSFETPGRFLAHSYGHHDMSDAFDVVIETAVRHWRLSSQTPWIKLAQSSGQGGGPAPVTVEASGLSTGRHMGWIQLVDAQTNEVTDEYWVDLTIDRPAFSFSIPPLGGSDGFDSAPVSFNVSLSTGENSFPWSLDWIVSSSPGLTADRITLDQTSGTTNGAGTTIAIDADRSGLAPGRYDFRVSLKAQVGEFEAKHQAWVQLNIEENRIYVPRNGFALSHFPGRSVLTGSTKVLSSRRRLDVPWQGSSDQPWLAVTASGTTGGELAFVADPAGLAADTAHEATITVTSPDAAITNTETIRVALWIGSSDPADVVVDAPVTRLAVNPVMPHAYAMAGDKVTAYNVHTGSLVREYTLARSGNSAFAVSSDGRTLYVTNLPAQSLSIIDLVSGASETLSTYSFWPPPEPQLRYVWLNGHPVLLGTHGTSFDLTKRNVSGSVSLGEAFAFDTGRSRTYDLWDMISGDHYFRWADLRYTSLPPSAVRVAYTPYAPPHQPGLGGDIAINAAGAKLYGVVQSPGQLVVRDPETLALQHTLTLPGPSSNVEVSSSGMVIVGLDTTTGVLNFLDPELTAVAQKAAPPGRLLRQQMALSGDETRVIVPTDQGHVGLYQIPR